MASEMVSSLRVFGSAHVRPLWFGFGLEALVRLRTTGLQTSEAVGPFQR